MFISHLILFQVLNLALHGVAVALFVKLRRDRRRTREQALRAARASEEGRGKP